MSLKFLQLPNAPAVREHCEGVDSSEKILRLRVRELLLPSPLRERREERRNEIRSQAPTVSYSCIFTLEYDFYSFTAGLSAALNGRNVYLAQVTLFSDA